MTELLPCPFCGHELYRSPRNHNPKAYCVTEDCYGKRMSVVNLDDPIIVAMWNARVGVAATAVRDATEAMALAGARSIGNTIHTDNHGVRARECWRAMWDARDGIVEPIPQGALVSRPHASVIELFVKEIARAPSLDENGYICTKSVAIEALEKSLASTVTRPSRGTV